MKTRNLLFAAVLMIYLPSGAVAGVPDLTLSTIPNVLVVPGGSLAYEMTLIETGGIPCPPGIAVDLVWTPPALAAACWCAAQAPPPLTAFTDPAGTGTVTFFIAGGECIDPAALGAGVDVFVGGAYLTTVGQVSPDVDNFPGAAGCSVGLMDAVAITGPLSTGAYDFCVDLNSDMAVGLADAVIATPFVAGGTFCP